MREDLLRRQTDGLQQDGHRHLATTVDPEIQDVLRIKLEVEPGPAVRNDAGREQQLARAVRLAAIMFKEHARRAVQLRNNHAFGAVDDERTGGGHERQFTHIHLLLLDLLDRWLDRFLVHDDQPDPGTQRRAECQTALLAFLDVKRGVTERVADKLETRHLVVGNDREDRRKRGLQTLRLAVVGVDAFLQELLVRLKLSRQHVGDVQHHSTLGEALADAFFLGERVSR